MRRTGVTLDGVTDDTNNFQKALNACNGRLYIPKGTIKTTAQVDVPAGTEIVCDAGATISAGANYHALNCKGSVTITGLKMTRADAAQNSSWKAINVDNAVQALPANSRVIVRDCVITGFDIGVYVDGGAAPNVDFFELSSSRIVINNLGTGGGASVRPTVAGNNCAQVVIRDNRLDASATGAVNNIYAIGSSKVDVIQNWIRRGHAVKVLSNAAHPVEQLRVIGNQMPDVNIAVICQADATPIRLVEIHDNLVDTPTTAVSDVGCVYLGILNAVAGAKAYEVVMASGNVFKNVPYSVWYPVMTVGNAFGTLVLGGNSYFDTSTADVGNYSIVNHGSLGTYDRLITANEAIVGNAHTRSYLQDRGGFTTFDIGPNIRERHRLEPRHSRDSTHAAGRAVRRYEAQGESKNDRTSDRAAVGVETLAPAQREKRARPGLFFSERQANAR